MKLDQKYFCKEHYMKFFKQKTKAFSLLEISLAIAIAGIAVSCITPIWHTITIAKHQRANEEKFHYIRIAMQAYLLRFGYLPCAAATENGLSTENTFTGFIPYKTLGIQSRYTKDCNGKPFTFSVNKNLVRIPGKNYILLPKQANCIDIPNQVSFCRLYGYNEQQAPTIINGIYSTSKYYCTDQICKLPNLTILEKGESIIDKNDYFHILPELTMNMSNPTRWLQWQRSAVLEKNDRYKICNTVAWLMISHGPNKSNKPLSKGKLLNLAALQNNQQQVFCISPDVDDAGLFNDVVFYQTRFDMAAQCGCPCTTEPMIRSLRNAGTEIGTKTYHTTADAKAAADGSAKVVYKN